MVVTGKPLACSTEKPLSCEWKWPVQTRAPLPAASAASRCSRPLISTSRRNGCGPRRSRITSTAPQELSRNHSRVTCCAAAGLSSSPSTSRRLRAISVRFPAWHRKCQSPRQHAMR
jgi:hypothetical protein